MNYDRELDIQDIVKNALKEDIGRSDITTEAIVPSGKRVTAVILAKGDFVVCGLGVAGLVFRAQDKNIKFKSKAREGDFVKKGAALGLVSGKARSILAAERVALNFLSLLCGIATKTRKFVNLASPYKVKIMDTRKTIPGLRILEKYAVRVGGGLNHRMSLDEMVLIKDNHLKVTGGYRRLPEAARGCQVEMEVKNLKEFNQALRLKPDVIMLDNMNIKNIKKAVKIRNSLSPAAYRLPPKLEASGGITLKNVKQVASCAIDMISIGELTHSVDSVDISLEIL